MVRTKCSPIPFGIPSNNTRLRLDNEPNDNSFKCSTLHFPTRVKLKAKRKFETPKPKELCPGPENSNNASQIICSGQSVKKLGHNRVNIRHKRQKSLHGILTKLIVIINNMFRIYYIIEDVIFMIHLFMLV